MNFCPPNPGFTATGRPSGWSLRNDWRQARIDNSITWFTWAARSLASQYYDHLQNWLAPNSHLSFSHQQILGVSMMKSWERSFMVRHVIKPDRDGRHCNLVDWPNWNNQTLDYCLLIKHYIIGGRLHNVCDMLLDPLPQPCLKLPILSTIRRPRFWSSLERELGCIVKQWVLVLWASQRLTAHDENKVDYVQNILNGVQGCSRVQNYSCLGTKILDLYNALPRQLEKADISNIQMLFLCHGLLNSI